MSDTVEYFGVPPSTQRDVESRVTYTSAAGQTSFAFVYPVGYVDVYRNGALSAPDEYTATSGTSVVFVNSCILGETIQLASRRQVPVTDVYTRNDANSMNNNFFGIGSGTGDAVSVTTNPLVGYAEVDGREVKVRWPAANTTAFPTINVNGNGVTPIITSGGHVVPANTFTVNQEVTLRYNATKHTYEALGIGDNTYTRSAGLTHLLYPSPDGGWRDIYKTGWRPGFLNQQWGGVAWGTEMLDAATNNVFRFDVATGSIVDNNTFQNISSSASNILVSQSFKVESNTTIAAIWLKLHKVGNPTKNLQTVIYTDNGSGQPSGTAILNSGSTPQSGRVHTNVTSGSWYRFSIPVFNITLTANTTYHVVVFDPNAISDASNYWVWHKTNVGVFPSSVTAQANITPTWSVVGTAADTCCFLVESNSAGQFLQTGGQFGSKLVFTQGTPLNQSKVLSQSLRTFFDGRNFTWIGRVSSAQASKPIADFLLATDHDRISVSANASGFATVSLWDKSGTLTTLTSSVSITGGAVSDIAVALRAYADGSDYLQLWVNGVKTNETVAQTYILDPLLEQLGTAWLGGGFPMAPSWTQDMQMTALPSAQTWTYTGTATQANAFAVLNGKLFQTTAGFAATDTGYYVKTTSLNNTTGWTVEFKMRLSAGTNTAGTSSASILIQDGTKSATFFIQQYFVFLINSGYVQGEFRNQENVFTICGKGSDVYVYINGKLAIDGTGLLVTTTATNAIQFGDQTATSGENSDAVWSYLKYYSLGSLTPLVSNGASLHEMAHFSGYRTEILPLIYNGGVPISIKEVCGVSKNYVEEVQWSEKVDGITVNPSSSSVAYTFVPEMQVFAISEDVLLIYVDQVYTPSTAGNQLSIIGSVEFGTGSTSPAISTTNTASAIQAQISAGQMKLNLGLHCFQGLRSGGGVLLTSTGVYREFLVKSTNNAAY